MQIIVNHLTRMRKPAICVAGWCAETGGHVRPVLPWEQLHARLSARHGGPFAIGRVVELGRAEPVGQAPEIEDYLFDPRRVRCIQTAEARRFWTLLEAHARTSLRDIFGRDLELVGGSCALPEGKGTCSLGCIRPRTTPDLFIDFIDHRRRRVRISLEDGFFSVHAAVTDLRLYERDHATPRRNVIARLRAEMRRGVPVLLSVGLGRPWQKADDPRPRHWMQVNNIHLQSYPVW